MTKIYTTKDDLRSELLTAFPGAPAEIVQAIDELVDRANAHRGDYRTYDAYLDVHVLATVESLLPIAATLKVLPDAKGLIKLMVIEYMAVEMNAPELGSYATGYRDAIVHAVMNIYRLTPEQASAKVAELYAELTA